MTKKYNVLWIDDQHESLSAVHKTAADFNLKLWPFKSMNGGCKELETNLSKYDAVLLDAKFFENETDEPGTEDTKWIHQTKDRIRDLDNTLRYFVLTGQAKTYASEEFNNAFPNVFQKGMDKAEDDLFKMLKEACENRELTRLKHKYYNAFALCEDAFIGIKQFDRILQLVTDIETPENIKNQQDALVPLRKILEAIFDKLHKIGLIPDEIQNGRGAINGASIFIAGSNKTYQYHQELIHPVIAESIRHILNLTQDASHNEGTKLKADSYLTDSNNTFLYQALCFTMLDVLDYIKPFIVINNDKVVNQSKWEVVKIDVPGTCVDWISGTVIRVAENGWGTFQDKKSSPTISIMPKMIDEYKLVINQEIEIITKQSLDGLKTHIKEIKIN